MPVGHEHHERVAMAVAVLPDRQVLARAQLCIWCAPRGDCSIFSGWRDQSQVRISVGRSEAMSRLLERALASESQKDPGNTEARKASELADRTAAQMAQRREF
jgi:hypothetical protein